MRRLRVGSVVAVFTVAALAGAGACANLDSLLSGGPANDGGGSEPGLDDSGPSCNPLLADGASRPGPPMVKIESKIGTYCIDTTEVTVNQFDVYLLAMST